MRYCFPTKDYLSYEKLASVLDPSPTSAPSLWRRVFDRQAVLAVFYQLDYAADVPRVSKCIRIRKERNSSLQYVLVPTVYLHGQELSDSHVSAILGSAVLRKPEDVTRLLESLDTAAILEKDKPKQHKTRRKRRDMPVRGPSPPGQIISTAFDGGSGIDASLSAKLTVNFTNF